MTQDIEPALICGPALTRAIYLLMLRYHGHLPKQEISHEDLKAFLATDPLPKHVIE